MTRHILSASSANASTESAVAEIVAQLEGLKPALIVFFTSTAHDGVAITEGLKKFAPNAAITGCSTAGEFTDKTYTTGAISVLAFSSEKVKRVATAMATYESGVEAGVLEATRKLSQQFGADLRELDPKTHVGFIFNEALHFREDEVDEVLGHAAPLLSFVGGSAGDDWQMKAGRVYENGRVSEDGCVLTLIELNAPYAILKTTSFESTPVTLRMDKVDGRAVHVINGKPAVEAYAEAINVPIEKLDHMAFMANPLGVMIDGEPWLRSVVGLLPDGALNFGARMLEGSELQLLRPKDLVGDTTRAINETVAKLGQPAAGAVFFNCAHRCLAINAMKIQAPFAQALTDAGFPIAGFHCYGEDWIVHLNQTLVGVVFA